MMWAELLQIRIADPFNAYIKTWECVYEPEK